MEEQAFPGIEEGGKEKQRAPVIKNRKKMTKKTLTVPDWRTMLLLLRTTVLRVMMILKEMIQAVI